MSEKENNNDQEKQHEATEYKLRQAAEKGDIPRSKELSSLFSILSIVCIILLISNFINLFLPKITKFLSSDMSYISHNSTLITHVFQCLLYIILFCSIMIIGPVLCWMLQSQMSINTKNMKLRWEVLSLKSGLKQLFSKQALMQALYLIIKLAILLISLILVEQKYVPQFINNSHYDVISLLLLLMKSLLEFISMVIFCFTIVAVLDYLYQWFTHRQKLKMTTQEMRDEIKEHDGDGAMKSARKQLAYQMRQNITKIVSEATVVVTNPTHYAVALKYTLNMDVPIVIAKGVDYLAKHIINTATSNSIAIIQNPPLARDLYDDVKINKPIQEKHYKAVVEIMRYVLKLNK